VGVVRESVVSVSKLLGDNHRQPVLLLYPKSKGVRDLHATWWLERRQVFWQREIMEADPGIEKQAKMSVSRNIWAPPARSRFEEAEYRILESNVKEIGSALR
jgi:hypothetical protein